MTLAEEQYLYLTTVGRKTGLPREIEIWFTHLDGRFYLIAEKRERANWVQNILGNPQVTFRVGEQKFLGVGRVIDEAIEADLRRRVCEGFDRKYGWSDGLIVELKPEE
jgi:deazaflavin-dependent oxidoreductase (nitroreductase family)